MYSLWTQQTRSRSEVAARLRFKRTGERRTAAGPATSAVAAVRARPAREARAGRRANVSAAAAEARAARDERRRASRASTARRRPSLRPLRRAHSLDGAARAASRGCGGPAAHPPSLFTFKKRDRTKEIHPRDYVSIAPDSLCPRAFLAGGGKSTALAPPCSARPCSAIGPRSSETQPTAPRATPVQCRYPFERDPSLDVGPSGSQGGMVYKLFTPSGGSRRRARGRHWDRSPTTRATRGARERRGSATCPSSDLGP